MQAIVQYSYGSADKLHLEEIPVPETGDNDVLVKIHAASLNAGDWRLMRATPFPMRFISGLLRPKYRLGADIAGRVEAVGKNVKQFKPGDEVYGDISRHGFGAFAEYASIPETALALKPTTLSFDEAAAMPAAATVALQGLRDKGRIQSGQSVLVNGASGGVGTFAVQIAKAYGAEVTAVCRTRNAEMVRSIGADHVIDYTVENFTKNGQRYDLILGANGYHSIFAYKRSLKPNGTFVMSGGSSAQLAQVMSLGPAISMTGSRRMGNMLVKPNQEDLNVLRELAEARKIKPVIDRRYRLSEVPDGIRYLEQGHARGKIVITM